MDKQWYAWLATDVAMDSRVFSSGTSVTSWFAALPRRLRRLFACSTSKCFIIALLNCSRTTFSMSLDRLAARRMRWCRVGTTSTARSEPSALPDACASRDVVEVWRLCQVTSSDTVLRMCMVSTSHMYLTGSVPNLRSRNSGVSDFISTYEVFRTPTAARTTNAPPTGVDIQWDTMINAVAWQALNFVLAEGYTHLTDNVSGMHRHTVDPRIPLGRWQLSNMCLCGTG